MRWFSTALIAAALLASQNAQADPRCYHDHEGRVLCAHGAYRASPYYHGARYRFGGDRHPADFGRYDPTLPTAHYICEADGTNCRWEPPRGVLKDY